MLQKSNSRRADLIIITTILFAGLIFSFGLAKTVDIGLYDESVYLYQGVTLSHTGFDGSQEAPLYAIWYFILSLLGPNRVNLFYLNYNLITILVPILAYGMLRRNKVSIRISFIMSLSLLVSWGNAYTVPRVSPFALIIILATFILIGHKQSLLWSSLLASMGALLVSYIRPEYFLTYLLATLLFFFLLVNEYKRFKKINLPGLIAFLVFSALFLGILGLPVAGDRSLVAFGQHFSVHWVAWTGNNLNPNTNWVEIMERNFGSAQSMLEAFARNPSAFIKHIGYNLLDLVKVSKLFFPAIYPKSKLMVGVGGVLIVVLLVAYLANNHFSRLFVHVSKIRENLPDYKGLLILVGLFLPPGIISMIIIYPHDRYVWLPIVLTLVTLTILSTEHDFEPMQMHHKQYLPLGLLVFVLVSSFILYFNGVQRPIFSTIRFIQSLGIHDAVNLLEAEGGYNTYLGDNFQRVAEYDKDTGFNQFRTNYSINMIVMSNSLQKDSRFIDDPEWQDFLTDYHQSGYLQMEIPNTDNKLIILADLLQK